jgi:hypothetical protein
MAADLTGTVRGLGGSVAAQAALARRAVGGYGSLPSTANLLGWVLHSFETALSTVLDSGEAGRPDPAAHGFTIVDRTLTRC